MRDPALGPVSVKQPTAGGSKSSEIPCQHLSSAPIKDTSPAVPRRLHHLHQPPTECLAAMCFSRERPARVKKVWLWFSTVFRNSIIQLLKLRSGSLVTVQCITAGVSNAGECFLPDVFVLRNTHCIWTKLLTKHPREGAHPFIQYSPCYNLQFFVIANCLGDTLPPLCLHVIEPVFFLYSENRELLNEGSCVYKFNSIFYPTCNLQGLHTLWHSE